MKKGFEKKVRFGAKQIIAAAAAVLVVVLIVLLIINSNGKNTNTLYARSASGIAEFSSYEASYADYLKEHGFNGTLSSSCIDIDLTKYSTDGELEAAIGETGVATSGDGSISWKFSAAESGFYNLKLDYLSLPGTTSDIQRAIRIDGEIPYDDCSQIVIRRWWEDYEIQSKAGNELRPNSFELYEINSWYIEDPERRNGEPMLFYLEAGEHTLSFVTIKEPMEFVALAFEAKKASAKYEDSYQTITSQSGEAGSLYTGETIVLQAERAENGVVSVAKSETSISVQKNHSDSEVVPYHAYYNRYNTIGATSWQNPGDAIIWTVNVDKAGYYRLSFKGRQDTNRGVTSYRRLTINGEVPFADANAIGFDYSAEMVNYVVSDAEGNPMLFYLNAGENRIGLEVVMGPFGSILCSIEDSLKVLNNTYLHVIQLTGQSPSRFIDYQITEKIPEFKINMKSESERLHSVVDRIVEITGEKGENTALLQKMAIEAEGLSEDPESVIEELGQLKNNISAVGTWIVKVSEMPLELDSLALSGKDAELPDPTEGFLAKAFNGTLRFFASFFIDTSSVGESEGSTDPLTVWVASYGKEQAQIIQNLVDNSFSPVNDIPVKIQLIPADVVLRAALAGNGPDVVIGLAQSTVQDFAMRNATLDLTKLEGYSDVVSVFPESSLMTASFDGGVYGLPETANFLMMFYREDILKELNIEVPTTWTEFIKILPILQQNNYSAFVPNAYLNNGSGNLNFYLALVMQYGGDIYTGKGRSFGERSGLSSNEAMEAFKDYTDFYTNYGLDVQVDFSNRFRTGEVPIGITTYNTFCTLEIFAPEIKGLWNFTSVPGTEKPDGSVDNLVLVDTADTVIMKRTKDVGSAWSFLKWWMSTDTQLDFCRTVESVMGTAARVPSANVEVIGQLPWSNAELKALLSQLENSSGIAAVPGYYMTNRMIAYSFSDVISSNSNPRESLYLNVESINKELARKRAELGLE